jgi:hypothetical protein
VGGKVVGDSTWDRYLYEFVAHTMFWTISRLFKDATLCIRNSRRRTLVSFRVYRRQYQILGLLVLRARGSVGRLGEHGRRNGPVMK